MFKPYFTVVFVGRSCFYSCQTRQCWPWPRWWITQSQSFLFKKQIPKEEVPFSQSTAIILPKEIQVSFSFPQEEEITLSETLQITLPLTFISSDACLLLCSFFCFPCYFKQRKTVTLVICNLLVCTLVITCILYSIP